MLNRILQFDFNPRPNVSFLLAKRKKLNLLLKHAQIFLIISIHTTTYGIKTSLIQPIFTEKSGRLHDLRSSDQRLLDCHCWTTVRLWQGSKGVQCPPAIWSPVRRRGIYLLAWTVSLNRTARSYGALQALSAVISRFTSDFQSQARIVGWEAVIKKPLHAHISYTSLSYVSRC